MPGPSVETLVCPSDTSRAALDFLHELLCRPADAGPSLDELLSSLAGAFGAPAAGVVRLADGDLLARFPRSANGSAGVREDGRLQVRLGPAETGWGLWLEDPGREQWTPGETAALALAGQVLGGMLDRTTDAPRWVRQVERAARQQRLEDAALLARRLAHDFGNVLTGIVGFSELALGQQGSSSSALSRYLTEVHRGAETAAAFIHQLRLFAGRHATTHRPCSLAGVLAEEEVRRKAGVGSGIDFRLDLPGDLPLLRVDAEMLRPVLGAVLDNAREALGDPALTPDVPRRIAVAARVVSVDAAECRDLYGELRPGTHVEIVVTDTGPGLDAQARERLFAEPFFSTRSRRRGFGLAIAYGVLCAHQGGIDVRPGADRGVEVRLLVPVSKMPEPGVGQKSLAASPRTTERNVSPSPGRGEKVLVVDDDTMMRDFAARVLEQAGYRVSAVDSAAKALETYAAAENDPFRVVLSDVLMPGINGVELAHRLLNRYPGARVLFMSGLGGAELLRQTFQGGSFELLCKPFNPEGLLSAVRGALERKGNRTRGRKVPPSSSLDS